MSKDGTIELWELRGKDDCRYSTFAWRTRLALLHKGLTFEVHPVHVSDKEAIAFSGQDKVPVIRDDGHVVSDSWKIAVDLERRYPQRPSLFGEAAAENLTLFFNMWADRELIPLIVPCLMRDVLDCVNSANSNYQRARMEGVFKKSLEELYGERAKSLDQFRRKLSGVRKVLEQSRYFGGETPSYADYILFSVLQWARIVSREQVLEGSDAVAAWFERMLDLYDRVGRRERSRADRMKDTVA